MTFLKNQIWNREKQNSSKTNLI